MHPALTQQLSAARDYELSQVRRHQPLDPAGRTPRRLFSVRLTRLGHHSITQVKA